MAKPFMTLCDSNVRSLSKREAQHNLSLAEYLRFSRFCKSYFFDTTLLAGSRYQ